MKPTSQAPRQRNWRRAPRKTPIRTARTRNRMMTTSASTDPASDFTVQGAPDLSHRFLELRLAHRLGAGLVAQPVGEADLVGLQRRALVAVEQRDAHEVWPAVGADGVLDVGRRRVLLD